MDNKTGVAAMVSVAAELESEGLITVALGRSEDPAENCVLEICGARLGFRVSLLVDGKVLLYATLLDDGCYETLLRTCDDPSGWDVARRLIASCERYEVASLERPILVGSVGDVDAWIIS